MYEIHAWQSWIKPLLKSLKSPHSKKNAFNILIKKLNKNLKLRQTTYELISKSKA